MILSGSGDIQIITELFRSARQWPISDNSFTPVFFNAGDVICRQHEISKGAYILLQGCAKASISSMNEESQVSTYFANQIFGFTPLMTGSGKNQLTVRAYEDCELILIPADFLFALLNNDPGLWQTLLAALAREMNALKSKMKISVTFN